MAVSDELRYIIYYTGGDFHWLEGESPLVVFSGLFLFSPGLGGDFSFGPPQVGDLVFSTSIVECLSVFPSLVGGLVFSICGLSVIPSLVGDLFLSTCIVECISVRPSRVGDILFGLFCVPPLSGDLKSVLLARLVSSAMEEKIRKKPQKNPTNKQKKLV